jgi:imidazolonepropionase-like amidohydrolase
MRLLALALMAGLLTGGAARAENLASPPENAKIFSIISSAGKHGSLRRWVDKDGTRWSRESILLRGMVTETDQQIRFDENGMIRSMSVRGMTPSGPADENFVVARNEARWTSQVDKGAVAYQSPAFYVSFGGTGDSTAAFVEALHAAPGKQLALLPSGNARLEPLTSLTVGTGKLRQSVSAFALVGFVNSPVPVWLDSKGKFFALAFGLAWLPAGYEADLPALLKAQDDAMSKRSPALARSLATMPQGPVAFTGVRLYDALRKIFLPDMTVVVNGTKIQSVSPASSANVPANAQRIDGKGKTLLPGLWDVHMHYGDDFTGPALLSLGVTSVRDPGNINELTKNRAERRARGDLLGPKVHASLLLDGKGPNSAQSGTTAASLDEALAAIRKAKADGFIGIKFYGSFNPAWLKASIDEAKKLGLHVHGHVPATMRPWEAVKAGYDEITHINFVMMQAMPDEVVNNSNGIQRFEGIGRFAGKVDLGAPAMTAFIDDLAARKIRIDPTLVVYESIFVPEAGDLSPAYAPFVGTLPPAVERGFRQSGFAVPKDLTRADYRKSFDKLKSLVAALHKAGVPIVAGTDGSGLELVRELELYVDAGLTPADALETATLASAKLVGADASTGSITPGKNADLLLVDGDPSARIGDLRHVLMVMQDGRLMDADALRSAAGFSGMPK